MLFHHVQKRMGACKIVVRQATVMEVVGCATVICTDKNGVLTQNKIGLGTPTSPKVWRPAG